VAWRVVDGGGEEKGEEGVGEESKKKETEGSVHEKS